jgi:hypothetical protein
MSIKYVSRSCSAVYSVIGQDFLSGFALDFRLSFRLSPTTTPDQLFRAFSPERLETVQ